MADLVDRARLGDEARHHLGVDENLRASTLIATTLPISGWTARNTVPNAALPELALDLVLADLLHRAARSRSIGCRASPASGSDTVPVDCKRLAPLGASSNSTVTDREPSRLTTFDPT